MKIAVLRTFALFIVLAIIVPGCKKELKTRTKINSDGSCERIVFVKEATKSTDLNDVSFPFPTDTSWKIRFEKLEGDTQNSYIAQKTFDNVNQLNTEYGKQGKIPIEIKFEKKFRWFFTYFTYQETYKWFSPFQRIPLTSFLSQEEYANYKKGDTSRVLKRKLDEFIFENMYEEFYAQLIDSVQSFHNPSLPVSIFATKKQALRKIMEDSFRGKDLTKPLETILGIKRGNALIRCFNGIAESLTKKLRIGDSGDYINEVSMPGIILSTNARAVEGNTVTWKFDDEVITLEDYTMVVESRIANPWATYATGAMLIVIVALLMLPRLKRK
jgi:hypothetical protein